MTEQRKERYAAINSKTPHLTRESREAYAVSVNVTLLAYHG